MNYLDFCEELFDKLTQDISQDYSDSWIKNQWSKNSWILSGKKKIILV